MASVLDVPHAGVEAPISIEATLNYTRKTGVRPVNYTFDPPDGVPRNSGEIETRRVTIRNGRLQDDLGLDRSGFTLIGQRSPLEDWTDYRDPDRVKAHYYPAVDAALRAHTGAVKVVIFDHTLRDSTAPAGRAEVRDPVRRVHDDQTFDSAPNRVRKHLPAEEAEQRLRGRFAIVNFWRPIGGPIEQAPLALCDARSIAPEDLIPGDLVYRDWTGETYSFAYNPLHRWYWYPDQQPDEVTLLKVFDSATDGTARLTAHTAFDDPNTRFDASSRRSIEVRTLLFW